MKIHDLINGDLLNKHLNNGMVSVQVHPDHPYLQILNYTHKAQYEPAWGDGTIDYCRGLIFDAQSGEVLARPFKKFHNLNTPSIPETMEENLPKTTPVITKKMDGSLGIWYPDGTPEGAIATRGSFTSNQALWATKYWKGRMGSIPKIWKGNWTPLFEIIYPENRIVVDYKGWYGLVVIGGVELESGHDIPMNRLVHAFGRYVVSEHEGQLASLEKLNTPNEEGFVASYNSGGVRVKIKFEDYKRLHRLVTGLNPRSIWELLRDGRPDIDLTGVPSNFEEWYNKWKTRLETQFRETLGSAKEIYFNRPFRKGSQTEKQYRAECAHYFTYATTPYPSLLPICFALLDHKDVTPIIWKQIEPAGNDKSFLTNEE